MARGLLIHAHKHKMSLGMPMNWNYRDQIKCKWNVHSCRKLTRIPLWQTRYGSLDNITANLNETYKYVYSRITSQYSDNVFNLLRFMPMWYRLLK
jgi:hypothetical protein